jgi:hypothetical protein
VSAALDQAAGEIDDDPLDHKDASACRTLRVRALTEHVAADVAARVGHALGAGPLGHNAQHARRAADLMVGPAPDARSGHHGAGARRHPAGRALAASGGRLSAHRR